MDDDPYNPVHWSGIPRYSKYFKCTKDKEMLLVECDSFNGTTPRSRSTDLILRCYGKLSYTWKIIKPYGSPLYTANCKNGDMRLVGGVGKWEGRLEICHNNRWGTVGVDSTEQWSQSNNKTVCGFFGYEATGRF